MTKKLTYIDFVKRNWVKLVILSIATILFVPLFIFIVKLVDLMGEIRNNSEDFNIEIPTGRYSRLPNGEYEEIIRVYDNAHKYLTLTMWLMTIPTILIWVSVIFHFFPI